MINPVYIALIPLLPVISFLVIALVGRKYFPALCGMVGTVTLLASFIIAAIVAYSYFYEAGAIDGVYQQIVILKYTWLEFSPEMSIDMGIFLDPISVMMIVIVTFISLIVHIYSLGYMHEDKRRSIYFSFLSLFTFSMLGLVLSCNIFQTYIFWELVGVSSFLLIGFYYTKPAAVAASKKAFIVTRFADLGFLIGILTLSYYTETFDFKTLIERASSPDYLESMITSSFLGISALTWGLSLIFIGGAGKSAMFPLHIWLPDAMEGPTPVSALIHAATMVVAGVYLVARLFPIFSLPETDVLDLVAYIGIFSSLFAAIIACTQTDIKRVLAYSTMSQIGFMMFSLGVSGYGKEEGLGFMASMFHLFTHSIFKALLFLGAGTVIHYIHSNDTSQMGGLRKLMPITHITFLIACLAIAGIPPFAGFFSKEEILLASWNSNKTIFFIALFTAALTAFYMFRLYFLIFWNKEQTNIQESHKHHEGTYRMLIPLVILALLTITAGFIPFNKFITSDGRELDTVFHFQFSIAPVILSICGILIATILYKRPSKYPENISEAGGVLFKTIANKFYFDEIYLFITKKIIFNYVGKPALWIEKNIISTIINGSGKITIMISETIKGIQSGKLQDYALYFFTGTIGLIIIVLFLYK